MNSSGRSVRTSSIEAIAHRVVALRQSHPTRVAVDGRTASGKTTFADELAAAIERLGRRTIRASIDGFHRPKAVRHRRGRLSPDGYYEDARDVNAMRKLLLDPLGPSGDRMYVTTTFDLERDEPRKPSPRLASEDAVLVVDGTFLQRPELSSAWDLVIFLDVPEEVARRRGVERDSLALGGETSTSELYLQRYGPAFTRYETECSPAEQADVLIDNSKPI
jgi:uridine kinase